MSRLEDRWVRESPAQGTVWTRWRDKLSGWKLQHCGHPTANWPYYLIDPDHPDKTTVSFNGFGFKTVAVCKEVIERLSAGELRTSDENCGATTRCVLGVTADGSPAPDWKKSPLPIASAPNEREWPRQVELRLEDR